jgi:hypothetical protein
MRSEGAARCGAPCYAESLQVLMGHHLRVILCAAFLSAALPAPAAAAADAVLYRIFLTDGRTLVSYGDFARVGDRVVFSMPIGASDPSPRLQLVTIKDSSVDWERTDRYAEAARAKRYAETRGENDFALLSAEVARALNEAALTPDPAKRLALAEGARKQLADWPTMNYGYRAADVAQLSALLDEVVSELRVAAGQSRFDVALFGGTAPPPPMALMEPPSLRESIELALTAARLTPEPEERQALLQQVVALLDGKESESGWEAALRARVSAELAVDAKVERAYADLTSKSLRSADVLVRRADVRGLEKLMRSASERDARLGRARPGEMAALMATLDVRLNAARRFRLERDAWAEKSVAFDEYRRRIKRPLGRLNGVKRWLEDVRALAGPSARSLERLAERALVAGRELALVKPPPELDGPHGLMAAAARMAAQAASARKTALASGDMKTAWDASSAAAGALMLIDQAAADFKRLTTPPQLR